MRSAPVAAAVIALASLAPGARAAPATADTAAPAPPAGFPAAVAMDGPVRDVCGTLEPTDGTCARVALRKVGGRRVAVFDARDGVGSDRAGVHLLFVAVELPTGWFVAHDPIEIEPFWREHGPGHTQVPRAPRLVPLRLASGRAAVGVDVRVDVTVDDCGDTSRDRSRPCAASRAKGSPVALIACGARADGSWACLPPETTLQLHDPPPRWAADGSITRGDLTAGYDVAAGERVAF